MKDRMIRVPMIYWYCCQKCDEKFNRPTAKTGFECPACGALAFYVGSQVWRPKMDKGGDKT